MTTLIDRTTADPTSAALEARFGLRIASLLNETRSGADHDISERLRISREQALARARASRLATAPVVATSAPLVGITASGAAVLGRHPADWWGRIASALPLLMLLGALVAIDAWQDGVQIGAAADVDAALLTDDLPPEAYSDPGFAEFLRAPQE